MTSEGPPDHDLSSADVAAVLEPVAREALSSYDIAPDAVLTLLNVSENATYAVDDPATGRRTVLRVHRLGYHSTPAIESELTWLDALREEAGIHTPHVIATRDGQRVLTRPVRDGTGQPTAERRHVVHFEWLPGTEPTPDDAGLVESFRSLGTLTATMHQHAQSWRRPTGFQRFAWDAVGAFGTTATGESFRTEGGARAGRWGRWQDGVGTGPAELEVLGRLDATLRSRLAAFGATSDRFGLVHADLRLANLLVDGDQTYVIDFDDCGWSWFLYDFGAAVSFFEEDPRIPELASAWVDGYRQRRELSAAAELEIPTFVMMRRLLLVAWIGSHAGTELARSMGEQYTAGSCELAESYLSRFA